MQNNHPGELEIVSLSFQDTLSEDLQCTISLMKGLQNFGEINFVIEKNVHQVHFQPVKVIKFFYIPRIASRKDVFFKIILSDIQNNQQIGQIPLSTNRMGQVFGKSKEAVIEQKSEFYPGILLHYRVHPPKFQIRRQPRIGFKKVQSQDLMSPLFALNKPQKHKLRRKQTKSLRQEEKPVNEMFGGINVFGLIGKILKPKNQDTQKDLKPQKQKTQNQSSLNIFSAITKIGKQSPQENTIASKQNKGQIKKKEEPSLNILNSVMKSLKPINQNQSIKSKQIKTQKKEVQNQVKNSQPNIFSFIGNMVKQPSNQNQNNSDISKIQSICQNQDDDENVFEIKVTGDQNQRRSQQYFTLQQKESDQQKNKREREKQLSPFGLFDNLLKAKNDHLNESMDSIDSGRDAQQFLGKTLNYVRQEKKNLNKKKHSLSTKKHKKQQHHQQVHISFKLQFVIFLLIFGIFMLCVDFLGDKKPHTVIQSVPDEMKHKQKKKKKNKNKKKIVHN